jgi:hypothetical protein
VLDQSRQSVLFVAVEPSIDRIGFAGFEHALPGDGVGRHAVGNLEERRGSLAEIGTQIAITRLCQFRPLRPAERERAERHHRLPSPTPSR